MITCSTTGMVRVCGEKDCKADATILELEPDGVYAYCDEHYKDEPPTLHCDKCDAMATVVNGGSFNDCPQEGGEEWGQEVYFYDLECGHRVYEAEEEEVEIRV